MLYFIRHFVGERPAIQVSVGDFLSFNHTIGGVNFYLLSALPLDLQMVSAGAADPEIKYETAFALPHFYRFFAIIFLDRLCSAKLLFA